MLQKNLSLPLENIIYLFQREVPMETSPCPVCLSPHDRKSIQGGKPWASSTTSELYKSMNLTETPFSLLLRKGGVGAITSSSQSWWKDLKRWGIWWLVDQSLKSSNIGNGYWRFQNFKEPGFPFSSHQHFHSLREAPPRIPVILFSAFSLIYMILPLTKNNLKRLSRYV